MIVIYLHISNLLSTALHICKKSDSCKIADHLYNLLHNMYNIANLNVHSIC